MSGIISEPSPSNLDLPIRRTVMAEGKGRSPLQSNSDAFSYFQKMIAELVGTYILMFAGLGASMTNEIHQITVPIVWGVVLTAAIYAVGHISGAHFNPAVSIAFAVVRKFSWKLVPLYIVAQVAGATLASLSLKLLFHELADIEATVTGFSDPTSLVQAFVFEVLITFFLMFTVCGSATDHRQNKDFGGIAIGGILLVNAMIAGPVTGASMNPARSLGPAIVAGIYDDVWVYVAAPIVGAIVAAIVYALLRVPEPPQPEKDVYCSLAEP